MTHMKRLHAVSRSMDWTAVYIDFKSKNCSISKYHREYFQDFCIRAGITDVVLGHTTVYEHLRQAALFYEAGDQSTETLQSNSSAEEPSEVLVAENNISTDTSNEEDSDPTQVAIFDLENLIATASKTESSHNSSSAPDSSYGSTTELKEKQTKQSTEQYEKYKYALSLRREAAGHIGIENIRRSRIAKLDREEREIEEEHKRNGTVFPDFWLRIFIRLEA